MPRIVRRFLSLFKKKSQIDKRLIAAVHAIVGYKPFNLKLFKLAGMHSSTATTNALGFKESNERLEYLGDAIVGAVIAELLYKKYPYKDEGFLTEIRARIVNRESLGILGKKIGLKSIIALNNPPQHGYSHKSLYGDTMEALIGAVFLDRGFTYCKKFIIKKLIEPHIDITTLVNTNSNYKSKIIEWAQKSGKSIRFETGNINDKGNRKEFEMFLFIDNELIKTGFGPNKKTAEQTAARKACEQLNIE